MKLYKFDQRLRTKHSHINVIGIRAEEKANYDTAKAELELGIGGVQKALGVLKDYYQGAAFVQGP